ncbi:MAG TPA: hypothetical protein VJN68_05685 [Burkholderiaceae bacterium]|nr:hypothetical protein [Burkholderiaceae bacterium]
MAEPATANVSDSERWCHSFATMYSFQQGCSLADALAVARMLSASLGELHPTDAVTTVTLDPRLAHALKGKCRDRP